MISLTEKEREAVLILLKEYTRHYNAHTLSKTLNISHAGTQKLLKRLLAENILVSKMIGKSIVYKLKLDDDYAGKLISLILTDEANGFKRWKAEFNALYKNGRIIMIFGSAIKDYKSSKDIDILIVINKSETNEINKFIKEKQEILPKKLHALKLTKQDLIENLKKKDAVIVDIIKNAIVLCGQDEYWEVMKNVSML